MAFDMYFGDVNAKIGYDDENLFIILSNEEGYVNLEWLWDEFYDGPTIDSTRSKNIASELVQARNIKRVKNSKSLMAFIDRILPFFEGAYTSDKTIKCISD